MTLRPKQPQDSRPKRSRTSSLKVRTGCITCKKRHLKCDEARPHCGNCRRSQRRCEGYPEPRKTKPVFGQFSWDSKVVTRHSAGPVAQQLLNRDILDFRDSESRLYFEEFIGLVRGPWVATPFGGDLWDVTLPQISRSNSTLRHAAMAIGALSKWHRQSNNQALSAAVVPSSAAAEGASHYFQAIGHYCQALKSQSQQSSVQDAVFLSILLLCFESLRGNMKAALDHINHGLALLVSLVIDTEPDKLMFRLGPDPKPLLSSLSEIFAALAPQARLVLQGRVGDGVPLPNFSKRLKDKNHTMETFLVLLSQLPRPSADLSAIPTRFNSLDEFQRFWGTSYWRQSSIGPVMMEMVKESNIVECVDGERINAFMKEFVQDPRFQEFYGDARGTMKALDGAFLPLFNEIMLLGTRSLDYRRAIQLRLEFLGIYMIDNTPQYIDGDTLEAQTPLFRQYLTLAQVAIRIARQEVNNPAHQLCLQRNFTLHLFLIALFCRDPLVREQATEMLREYPGQDGLFPTQSLYITALRNREIERQNAIEGDRNDQWRRLWRREWVFEEGGDRIVLRHMEKDAATGDWVLVEETADVRGTPEEVRWERRPPSRGGKLLMGELFSSS